MTTRIRATIAAALAVLALAACDPSAAQPSRTPDTTATTTVASDTGGADTAPTGDAQAALETLTVKGKASGSDYDADSYGWREDTDRNGCDTRNDVLRRDLIGITFKANTNGCVVATGALDDPYSGEGLTFVAPNPVDIDHVVARKNAEITGAFAWTDERKAEFANDPLNLLAVEGSLNRQKGDADAATWLPPNKPFRCEYVARQIAVKAKYELWVVPAEKDAMTRVLSKCPGQELPDEADQAWPSPGEGDVSKGEAPTAASTPEASAPAEEAPEEGRAPSDGGMDTQSSGEPFANCKEARAAGAAPVHRGDPGYSEGMDGDGDGVACE